MHLRVWWGEMEWNKRRRLGCSSGVGRWVEIGYEECGVGGGGGIARPLLTHRPSCAHSLVTRLAHGHHLQSALYPPTHPPRLPLRRAGPARLQGIYPLKLGTTTSYNATSLEKIIKSSVTVGGKCEIPQDISSE